MAITPFMFLDLPTPTVTLGPAWAEQINEAFETVSEHDHSDGKGTTIKTAGIEINANLDINSWTLFGLKSLQLETQASALTGASNAQSLYSLGGNLYFTSGSGTAVQLTSGGSIVATPGTVESLTYTAITSDTVIPAAATYVVLGVNTSAARTITLPSAALVAAGRIFLIKDLTGTSETNNITILPDGADGIDNALSLTINSNFGAAFLITNGVDTWMQI